MDDDEDRKRLAQITINRLIFVKFIESKGWINNNPRFLKELRESFGRSPAPAGFYKTYLEPLFFLALNEHGTNKPHPYENVRYLNGGLFRKSVTESKYPNYDVANDILLSVVDFLEEYSFEIKGAEKVEDGEEALDPEILGYIFERTANHEAGAYYTPENITTYISDQTIESLILERVNAYLREKGKGERTNLYTIFGTDGLDIDDLRNLYEKRRILDVKVLDPACGSGAFFIPAIRKLLDLNKKFYVEINRSEPDIYQLQKSIVEKNIYGVDINSEAVEIAKLRLWLDLLDAVEDIDKVDSLPNIEYNVMAGNSLIGAIEIPGDSRAEFYQYYHPIKFEKNLNMYPEFVEECKKLTKSGEQFETTLRDILRLRNKLVAKYREETHPNYSYRLREVIQGMSDVFREEISKVYLHKTLGVSTAEEREEMKKKLKPFHWGMEFSDVFEQGGFDVVIGNPPYVNNRNLDKTEKKCFEEEYETAYQQYDIFVLFYELGLRVLRTDGILGFITSNKFAITKYALTLRSLFLKNKIRKIVDISKFRVFREASTYPYVVILQKTMPHQSKVRFFSPDDLSVLETNGKTYSQKDLDPETGFLFGVDSNELKLLEKIHGEKLIDIFRAKPTSASIKVGGSCLAITNKEVEKYHLKPSTKHIAPNEKWKISLPAILMKKICYVPTCALLDKASLIPINTVYVIHPTDKGVSIHYLMAILNSKLMAFYTRRKYAPTAMSGGFIELRTFEISDLPIKRATSKEEETVSNFSKKLSDMYKSGSAPEKDLEALYSKIDNLVYKVYGLDEEEIRLVETSPI